MSAKKIGKNIVMSLMIPVIVYLFFFILCNATGHAGFGVGADLQTILYTSVYSGLIALAMSMNLTSGRFDFSIGASMVLAIIVGGNIAKEHSMGAWGMLAITVLIAAIIGLVSGLVYVLLGLPPMVVSLGLAMIYEALGFMYNRAKGVKLMGKSDMLIFSKLPWAGVIIVIVLAVLVIVWDYTKFGYNRKALASGQKIATDVGINEKKNAVICYVISGILLGIAGCVYISKYGTVSPETGLSSSSYFMTAFLPMFIGGAISKYSSHPIAVFIGAVTQAFITSGLSWMGCSSSIMTVLNGVIVMAFLIYTSNSYLLVEQKMFHEKLEKAKAARAEKG
jgi:ribose transport system permease protein